MGSPLTGSVSHPVELVRIETNLFDLYIVGKPMHPTVEQLELHRNRDSWVDAMFEAVALHHGLDVQTVEIFSQSQGKLLLWSPGIAGEPIFYENQNYEFVVEKKEPVELSFYHQSPHLRQAVKPLGKTILSGILNFRSEVGLTDLEVRVQGQSALRLKLEVFPSKLDYRRDYQQLLQEVNEQIYNLAFDFLRRTYQQTGLRESGQPSLTEFFSILRQIFRKLMAAMERIQSTPHTVMQEQLYVRDAARVRKAGRSNIGFLRKNPHLLHKNDVKGWLPINGSVYHPQKLLESQRKLNYDTNENRFVRWMLLRIDYQLGRIVDKVRHDSDVIENLTRMRGQIRRWLQMDFLQVGEMKDLTVSLVLQMGVGYREVYRYYLMLMKGLSLQSDLFQLSMKDVAQLYEYWCFLKIHHLLSKKYKLLQQDVVKVNRSGLFVTLDQTQKAKMTYQNPRNGEVFTLYYNALPQGESADSPTLAQRPDNVLTLKKNDSSVVYNYVFDAKYRLDPGIEGTRYQRMYGGPGPQEEDINTMHRYRDAIVVESGKYLKAAKDLTRSAKSSGSLREHGSQYERSMFGAYVLFPYADEEKFREHKFYKSIELINIGAFPFLPGATSLLEEFLDEIIMDSPEKAYERSIRPRGTNEYYTNQLIGKNVMIGSMREKSQLDVALRHRFYHTPLKNITEHSVLTQLEYVGLYQSRRAFGEHEAGIRWYGKIKSWGVVRREEIRERPARPSNKDELYVRFEIEEWQRREPAIVPNGIGVYSLLFTSSYLFERARELAELKLEDEKQLREWRELRRKGLVHVELDHSYVDLARQVTGMRVEN